MAAGWSLQVAGAVVVPSLALRLVSATVLPPIPQAAGNSKTVWDGVYTSAQATRGEAAYQEQCSVCHGAGLRGTDEGPSLAGRDFEQHWFEDSVKNLFIKVRTTMPADAPGSLAEAMYLDIVAHVLRANGFPAGETELPLDVEALSRVQIVGKGGPGAIPDSALVQVIGCLTRDRDSSWIVTRTTPPVRTRDPDASAAVALDAAKASPPGTHAFRLLEIARFDPATRAGHRVEVKGFLVRRPGDDRLNVTALQTLASSCDP
jgi:mono/diheme cytochrome c family protein